MPNIAETIKKVRSFSELENGWHFGEGVAPSTRVQDKAIAVLHGVQMIGLSRSNAFPGVNGEIEITFYHRDSFLELTFETDGSLTIPGDEDRWPALFKEGFSIADVITKLSYCKWQSLNLT